LLASALVFRRLLHRHLVREITSACQNFCRDSCSCTCCSSCELINRLICRCLFHFYMIPPHTLDAHVPFAFFFPSKSARGPHLVQCGSDSGNCEATRCNRCTHARVPLVATPSTPVSRCGRNVDQLYQGAARHGSQHGTHGDRQCNQRASRLCPHVSNAAWIQGWTNRPYGREYGASPLSCVVRERLVAAQDGVACLAMEAKHCAVSLWLERAAKS